MIFFALTAALVTVAEPPKIIVVTVTEGYRHESIETAELVISSLAASSERFTPQFVRSAAELPAALSADALASAKAVMFVNTTGELAWADRQRLLDWIAAGGSFIGVHSASDTWHEWTPYLDMLGGEFATHPPESEVEVFVDDFFHPAARHMSGPQKIFEEIYLFNRFARDRVKMILSLRASPEDGAPGFFPLSWHRRHGRGRVFYTALGHRVDIWQSEWFQKHLLGGIESVLPSSPRRRAVAR